MVDIKQLISDIDTQLKWTDNDNQYKKDYKRSFDNRKTDIMVENI